MGFWRIKAASIFIIFIIIFVSINAQTWTNGGPYGGTISSMAVDPVDTNIVYAGTKAAGIYRSTNGGDYWEAINDGIPIITDTIIGSPTEPSWWDGDYHRISAIKISPFNPSHLYAGTAGSGIVQSFDYGNSWTPTNTGLPDSAVISALWLQPQDSMFLISGTAYPAGGLYRSTDAGFSWVRIDSVPHGNTYGITTMENHPMNADTIYVAITSAGEPGFAWGIMRTPDGGDSWDIVNETLTFYEIAIDPNNPQKMWSWVMNDFGMFLLFYSDDKGYNWNPYPDITNFWDGISLLYADPDWNLYVIDEEYSDMLLRKSTDHGQTWDSLSIPFSPADIAANLFNTQTVYFGTRIAPYRSVDGGQTFAIKDSGMINTYIYDVAVNPKNSQIIYAGGEQGFWKSSNGTDSWLRLQSKKVNAIAVDPKFPDTLYWGGSDLIRSYDGVNTYSNIKGNIPGNITDIATRIDSSNIIYVSSYILGGYLFKSFDYGENWELIFSTPPASFKIENIMIERSDPQIMYFGASNNLLNHGLYKSTNGGDLWNKISDPGQVYSIALHPSSLDTIYIATLNKIMLSANGGISFTEIGQAIPSQYMSKVTLDTLNPSHIYVGTKDKGVFYSYDAGQSWQRLNGDYNVRNGDIDLVPHENRMFLGTNGYGVWRGDNVLLNVENDERYPVIAQTLQLLPAYPNPFNSQITIPFYVPVRIKLKLSVHNIRGQKVKDISNQVFDAGYHEVQWDGTTGEDNTASSGIYFIRLSDITHSEIRKILLIK